MTSLALLAFKPRITHILFILDRLQAFPFHFGAHHLFTQVSTPHENKLVFWRRDWPFSGSISTTGGAGKLPRIMYAVLGPSWLFLRALVLTPSQVLAEEP